MSVARPAHKAYDGLELLRFLAALGVLFWHYQFFYLQAGPSTAFARDQQPLHAIFSFFYAYGHYGVHVFWALSGFIFFWKYRESIHQQRVGAWKFTVLRFSRLYPLHLLTLLMVAGLQAVYKGQSGAFFLLAENDVPHFLLQLLLATSWWPGISHSFNAPIWSISAEIAIYALFFVQAQRVGMSVWLSTVVVITLLLAKAALPYSAVIDCGIFFYLGGLTFLISEQMTVRWGKGLTRLLQMGAAVLVPGGYFMFKPDGTLPFGVMMALVPCVVAGFAAVQVPHVGLRTRFGQLGDLTYASYLLHFPVQLLLLILINAAGYVLIPESPLLLLVYLLVVLVTAALSFSAVERPVQSWIRARLIKSP